MKGQDIVAHRHEEIHAGDYLTLTAQPGRSCGDKRR